MPERFHRFEVIEQIASGTVATLYKARDSRADRTVALKVMHPHLAGDASYVDRFVQAAKESIALAEPNVVSVLGYGKQGDAYYLVIEYLPDFETPAEMGEALRYLVDEPAANEEYAVVLGGAPEPLPADPAWTEEGEPGRRGFLSRIAASLPGFRGGKRSGFWGSAGLVAGSIGVGMLWLAFVLFGVGGLATRDAEPEQIATQQPSTPSQALAVPANPKPTATLAPGAIGVAPSTFSETVAVSSAATSTPLASPKATFTPRPNNALNPSGADTAPRLLDPGQNASFGAPWDKIVLRWELDQGLMDDKNWFYLYISVPEAPQWDVHHFTKDKSYQIGSYLCGSFTKFNWHVVPWHQTGNQPKDGVPAGPQSETRTFFWTACRG